MAIRQGKVNKARRITHDRLVIEIGQIIRSLIDGCAGADAEKRLASLRDEDMRNSGMAYDEAIRQINAAMGLEIVAS